MVKLGRCLNIQTESETDTKFISWPFTTRRRWISAGRRLLVHQKALASHTDLGIWLAEVASAAGFDAGQDFRGPKWGRRVWIKKPEEPDYLLLLAALRGTKSRLDSPLSVAPTPPVAKQWRDFEFAPLTAMATESERRPSARNDIGPCLKGSRNEGELN